MKAGCKKISLKLAAGLLLLFSLGCSNQWRNADLEKDAQDVMNILNNIEDEVSTSGTVPQTAQNFFNLKNDLNSSIYYAEAFAWGGPLGPIASVFSIYNYEFAGPPLAGLSYNNLTEVRVAFIDLPTDSGHQCGLMVDSVLMADGSANTAFYSCTSAQVDGGEFIAQLERADGYKIALRSFDVDQNGDFKGVIQLKVYDIDSAGNEISNGKLSTLVGFGP